MEGKKFTILGVNVFVQPGSRILKLLLIALIVLSMVSLGALWWVRAGILADTDNLRQEAAQLIDANAGLEDKIDNVDSIEGILDIAGNALDLVDPNTVVIQPTETQPTQPTQ